MSFGLLNCSSVGSFVFKYVSLSGSSSYRSTFRIRFLLLTPSCVAVCVLFQSLPINAVSIIFFSMLSSVSCMENPGRGYTFPGFAVSCSISISEFGFICGVALSILLLISLAGMGAFFSERTTSLSTSFSSSLTFPGQG